MQIYVWNPASMNLIVKYNEEFYFMGILSTVEMAQTDADHRKDGWSWDILLAIGFKRFS
uniref:Uncharacterized protein n=1 Tax=Rhizophora mucronata TaxID=61149 RepID=A0A2P2N8X5_RHIMU